MDNITFGTQQRNKEVLRHMTRIFSRGLILLLTVLLIAGGVTSLPACAPSSAPQVTLGQMDIIDATHLFIAPGSANKLFKITEEGYIQEVTYEDENGNNITMVNEPGAIYDVNSEYVIVVFDVIDVSDPVNGYGYLVRKTDGTVFSLKDEGPIFSRPYRGDKTVFTDSSGNIFYCTSCWPPGPTEIIKLDTGKTDSITKTVYSPSGDTVGDFVVDKDGNAAYHGSSKADVHGAGFIRIRTAEGSIHDHLFDDSPDFWLGPDGVIYCTSFGPAGNETHYCLIEKVSVNVTTGVPTKSEYSAFNVSGEVQPGLDGSYKLELQDRVIFVWPNQNPNDPIEDRPQIFEFYNPTNSARCLNMTACFGLTRVYSAIATDNFYYLHGSNSTSGSFFVKVDPTDDSYTVLSFSTDEYYLYTWAPSTADELIFNALRMSDGVNVVGKFDVSGDLTILDEKSDVEIIVLERIQ